MSQRLTIRSVKRTEEFTGPMYEAIQRAVQIESEYRPAFGVQIEDEDGAILWDSEVDDDE